MMVLSEGDEGTTEHAARNRTSGERCLVVGRLFSAA